MQKLPKPFQRKQRLRSLKLSFLAMLLVAANTFMMPMASGQLFVRAQAVEEDEEADDVESGASLKTSPDLEALLEKAERYREDGNYRVATKLWQAVLQRSGDALYTRDRENLFLVSRRSGKDAQPTPDRGPLGVPDYRRRRSERNTKFRCPGFNSRFKHRHSSVLHQLTGRRRGL